MAVLAVPAPPSASDFWARATADYDADRYGAAAEGFEHVTAMRPHSGLAWAMLGLCEYQTGRRDAALQYFELARKLGLSDNDQIRRVASYHEGLLLLDAGRFEDAQTIFDGLAAEQVNSPRLKTALGKAVLRTRQESPALELAGEAEWEAANNEAQAGESYARLAGRFGSVQNVHFAYGKFLLSQRRNEQAAEAFQKELQVTPQHVLARLALADMLRATDPRASLPYAREALELAPNLPLARYLMGMCLLDNHQAGAAIPELEAAARLMPGEPRIFYGLARAYSSAGRRADAAQASKTYAQLKSRKQP